MKIANSHPGLLLAAIGMAALSTVGGRQFLPLRLSCAAAASVLGWAAMAQAEQRKRRAYLDDYEAQLDLQKRQIMENAHLEGLQSVAHFQAAERIYAEHPWMADYMDVQAEPVPETQAPAPDAPPSPTKTADPDAAGAQTQAALTATVPDTSGLFDWHRLKDADRHPILGLIAKMGGGKSLLAKYLGKHILGGSITVFDIYGSDADWAGCEVLYNFDDMVRRMELDNQVIEEEIAQYRSGKRDFTPRLIVLEEGKATINRLKKRVIPHKKPAQIVEDWKLNHESVTRKIRRRLCLVSTNMNSSVLDINAETRDEITLIFPGSEGIGKAMKDTQMLKLGAAQNQAIRERLLKQLEGVRRKALVYHDGEWFAAAVPELDEHGNPAGYAPPSPPPPQADWQKLEALLSLEAEPDAEPETVAHQPSREEEIEAIRNCFNLLRAEGKKEQAIAVGKVASKQSDFAIWLGLKHLGLRVSPACVQVFGFGDGGRRFQRGKAWYEALEAKFGPVLDD